MFTEGLYSLLIADAGVSALLGAPSSRKEKSTGVFPNVAPDEVSLPYVVFTQVHREPVLSYQGVNRLAELRFQFSCYGSTYKASKVLANAVKNLLDGFIGTLSEGSYVSQSIPVSEHDETEPVFKGTVYGVILDYSFWTNG